MAGSDGVGRFNLRCDGNYLRDIRVTFADDVYIHIVGLPRVAAPLQMHPFAAVKSGPLTQGDVRITGKLGEQDCELRLSFREIEGRCKGLSRWSTDTQRCEEVPAKEILRFQSPKFGGEGDEDPLIRLARCTTVPARLPDPKPDPTPSRAPMRPMRFTLRWLLLNYLTIQL